jgi:NitT/TauT family transport system ATP-binding protein
MATIPNRTDAENVAVRGTQALPEEHSAAKLELRNISKTFATARGAEYAAIDNISVKIAAEEFVCIAGPSGSGKTTLLMIMAGLVEPSSGEMLMDGKAVRGPGRDRGMVFQQDAIFPWRTVRRNVEYGLEVAGVPKEVRRETAMTYIRMVGLEKFADFYPKELSGGMKKRVALATVFANDPTVLLMDEPFGSLDYATKTSLQEELMQIWSLTHKTTIFVTHDVDEAVFLGDRVLVLRDGRLDADLRVPLERPRTEEIRLSSELAVIRQELLGLVRASPIGQHREGDEAGDGSDD